MFNPVFNSHGIQPDTRERFVRSDENKCDRPAPIAVRIQKPVSIHSATT